MKEGLFYGTCSIKNDLQLSHFLFFLGVKLRGSIPSLPLPFPLLLHGTLVPLEHSRALTLAGIFARPWPVILSLAWLSSKLLVTFKSQLRPCLLRGALPDFPRQTLGLLLQGSLCKWSTLHHNTYHAAWCSLPAPTSQLFLSTLDALQGCNPL